MTKEVLIIISGMQFSMGDELIELKTLGNYYLKNDKHYVIYEEMPQDNVPVTKNLVKFYDGYFEMTKKGGNNSYLLFERGKKTSTVYQTIAGPIQIDAVTHDMTMEETEDELNVYIKYTLDINYKFVSDCEVTFKVRARG